jgi:hypothetical protein
MRTVRRIKCGGRDVKLLPCLLDHWPENFIRSKVGIISMHTFLYVKSILLIFSSM